MPKNVIKVYSKESNIPNIGKGLFAKVRINKGSIIQEFKGKILSPDDLTTSNRSNIYFNDCSVLQCGPNDLASFANDAINFHGNKREIIKALESNKPFYKKHRGMYVNAEIKINHTLHRAFLVATDDIFPGEEIYTHYGFMYWFTIEITCVGFLQEEEIETNGFPEKIFEYPAFISYIKEFYGDFDSYEAKQVGESYELLINFHNNKSITMRMENFSGQVTKVAVDDVALQAQLILESLK